MKKTLVVAIVAAMGFSGAALAETTKADIEASERAIKKDDAAIAKQHDNIKENRAEKQAAKDAGNPVDQASQSVQIGANKAVIQEKKIEKKIDQEILEHQKEKAAEQNAK